MSSERKLWRVTLTREIDVYVSAADRHEAERIAIRDGEDDLDYANIDASGAHEVTAAPKHDRDAEVYGDERTVGEWLDGVPPLSERAATWEREQPETLDALLAWAARMPCADERFPYHVAVAGGAAVGDGWAVLIVDGASAPEGERLDAIEKAVAKVSAHADARATYTAEQIAAWLAKPEIDGEVPRIGSVLGVPIDRALVARAVGHAARITGCSVKVSVGPMGTLWSGDDWRAVVMPLRAAARSNGPTGPALGGEP